MPPYRRIRWIVGGILVPQVMVAAAYVYTKPYSHRKKVIIFLVLVILLEAVILSVSNLSQRWFDFDVLSKPIQWIIAYPFLLHFWKQLPDEDKRSRW